VRPLLTVQLSLCIALGTVVFAADARETIKAANFKKVDVFTRNALFVVKDEKLSVLRTTEKGAPKAIFTISKQGHLVSDVGVAEKGDAFFVSDGTAIFRVTPTGQSKTVLTLSTLRADSLGKDLPDRFRINWFLAAGPGDTLHFDLLPNDHVKEPTAYVCRYEPISGRAEFVKIYNPNEIDVDRERGIVYSPPSANGNFLGLATADRVLISTFADAAHPRRLPVSHQYDSCQLSPDRKTLLLSESPSPFEVKPHIATLDLSSGRETVLPFSGSYATWGTAESIYFVRGDKTLWTAKLRAAQPTLLFEALGQSASDSRGSYAEAPVLSRDASWLAWRWALKDASGVRLGTVLVDLKNHEYRLVGHAWHNVNWAK
jgi:hypothetical protein